MSEEKQLAKIEYVEFGLDERGMMGIHFTFSGPGWGVGTSEAFWTSEWSEHCKWTCAGRIDYFGNLVLRIAKWLEEAKVKSVSGLKGKPVEVTLENNMFKSFRILTEVL